MRSIPRHLIEEDFYIVNYLVYKDINGNQKFLYLAVRESDMPDYQEALKTKNFIAEDYGIVLDEGDNDASDILKEKMELLYKCKHPSK
jgi:hypothetical protein